MTQSRDTNTNRSYSSEWGKFNDIVSNIVRNIREEREFDLECLFLSQNGLGVCEDLLECPFQIESLDYRIF